MEVSGGQLAGSLSYCLTGVGRVQGKPRLKAKAPSFYAIDLIVEAALQA
jgi:hypothetical protein